MMRAAVSTAIVAFAGVAPSHAQIVNPPVAGSGTTVQAGSSSKPTPISGRTAALGTSLLGNANSWFEALTLQSGGQIQRIKNGAIPGSGLNNNSPTDRTVANALIYHPGIVVLQPCRNDSGSAACLSATMRMALDARHAGALVGIATELPNQPTPGAPQIAALLSYNIALKASVIASALVVGFC